MVRSISKSNGKEYYKFICSTYIKYGSKACSCHLIQEDALTEIIKVALNKHVFSIIDFEKRINQISGKEKKKNICILELKKKELQDNIAELMNLRAGLYSDYKLGIFTLAEYNDMKIVVSEKLKCQEENIDFIEEIIVDKDKNIRIKFKFEDELKKYHSIFE